MRTLVGGLILSIALLATFAAESKIPTNRDSLEALLRGKLPDSSRVDVLIALHKTLTGNDAKGADQYLQPAIALSEAIGDNRRAADAYLELARVRDYAGDMAGARSALAHAREKLEYVDDMQLKAAYFMHTGIIDYFEGSYDEAVTNLWSGLRIYEKLGDSISIASCFLNIGNSYRQLEVYDKSLEYYLKGLDLYKEKKYEVGEAMAYGNIGFIYRVNGDLDRALEYYLKSLDINDENRYPEEARIDLHNIGVLYMKRREYDKALEYLDRSLSIARRLGSEYGIVAAASEIARVRLESGAHNVAAAGFLEVLEMAKARNFKEYVMVSYEGLSDTYAAMGQYRRALHYRKEYEIWKDSLINENNLNQVKELELKYETEKKDERIRLLANEAKIQEKEAQRQSTLKRAFIGGLILVTVIGLLIAYTLRQRLVNQRLLAEKNEEIRAANFRREMSELEMKALRAQINPHFLFNCLNSINRMILEKDNDNASLYLTKFSRLVRLILENTERSSVPLQNELALLESYIQLESLRFKDRIDYRIRIDKSVDPDSTYLPSMILQPFVENAIWHGLMHKADHEKGIIQITIGESGGRLQCVIEDNGVGRDKAKELQDRSLIKSRSLGAKITEERLRLLNHDGLEHLVSITDVKDSLNRARGTRVEINIPVS
jgi:tetratricopeptide (TPR) repeat protein